MVDESFENQNASADAVEPADLNSASLRRLVQIPGIGRALARRIIEARPFKNLQDLERVEGLGDNRWEEMAPYVCVISDPALDAPEISEADQVEANKTMEASFDGGEESTVLETSSEVLPGPEMPAGDTASSAEPAPAPPAEKTGPVKTETVEKSVIPYPARQPAYATRRFVLWTVILGGCALLILAVLIPLGILSSFNDGLHYARPTDLIPLQQDINQVNDDIAALRTDLTGVRTRLDNLEGLSGRILALESAQKSIQAQQKDLQTQIDEAEKSVLQAEKKVETIQSQVGEVQSIVDLMKAQVEKFRGFLDGLSKLMGGLVVP